MDHSCLHHYPLQHVPSSSASVSSQHVFYHCLECPDYFYDEVGLANHQRCHSTAKPFRCCCCTYSSKNKRLIKEHERKHSTPSSRFDRNSDTKRLAIKQHADNNFMENVNRWIAYASDAKEDNFSLHKMIVIVDLCWYDEYLQNNATNWMFGEKMTDFDLDLLTKLQILRVVGRGTMRFDFPNNLVHLWRYMQLAYNTQAFSDCCPSDQEILSFYKVQLNLFTHQRATLQAPTKTHTLPEEVLDAIKRLGMDQK